MRIALLCLALAAATLPEPSHAQVTMDMTRLTCANYLAMSPSQARVFSAWMSGWFNQKYGYVSVGFDDLARNITSVSQWCASNPQETIMAALDRSHPQPGPPGGQVKVDMSLITCRQYLKSGRQEIIAYWMSGYFRASVSQPVFAFEGFAKNKNAVDKYCKKHGGETLMSAIQNGARS